MQPLYVQENAQNYIVFHLIFTGVTIKKNDLSTIHSPHLFWINSRAKTDQKY